jgi:histidinol phosphatase-like enzyme (inositol monophosphatase family)
VDAAVGWAREAGKLTLGHFRSAELGVRHKADGSPVTLADTAAEELLRSRVTQAFPEDSIVGEEGSDVVGSSGRTWVMDPIDGTKAFAAGVGTYSNLLYLEDSAGPVLGIINLPALAETIWAVRGQGCFWNGSRARVADSRATDSPEESPLSGSTLCTSGFHEWTPEKFGRVQDAGVELRTWGDAYGYALLATGRVQAMYDPLLAWWDLAAVNLVVAEAGGKVTAIDGDPEVTRPRQPEPYPFSALASTGTHHDEWVRILR